MDQHRIDIESLLYRTEKLEEKCAEIRHLVSGTGEDYTHLLRTKTGRFSSKSVNRLVNDLIGCLAEYRSYMEAVRKGHQAGMEKMSLSDEDKEEKILENPKVIKTPVVRNGKKATLGYCPDVWKEWD